MAVKTRPEGSWSGYVRLVRGPGRSARVRRSKTHTDVMVIEETAANNEQCRKDFTTLKGILANYGSKGVVLLTIAGCIFFGAGWLLAVFLGRLRRCGR